MPAPRTQRQSCRLEPTIALAWKSGEAAHPRLRADGGTVTWQGQVHLARAGGYRFAVNLRGLFRLTVAGKVVLKVEARDAVGRKQGEEVQLAAGDHPLQAEFERLPGPARLELLWTGPGFREEPFPHDVVGHLPSQAATRLERDKQLEHGRFLAEERRCLQCHRAEDGDAMARGLAVRRAPDLSQVGGRAYPGWIERWLESPRKLRPDAVMPELFTSDQAGRVGRRAVAAYLSSLGGPVRTGVKAPPPEDLRASLKRGQVLYLTIGCTACHGELFSGLGSKTAPAALASYLRNPLLTDPAGRMPGMLLAEREADDVARFLCSSSDDSIRAPLSPAPAREQLLEALARVETRPDERAQFAKLPPEQQWLNLGKRLVIDKGCNNCHTIAPDGKPFAAMQSSSDWGDIVKPAAHKNGCLAEQADQRGRPGFGFDARERAALRAFLTEGTSGAGSPADAYSARIDLQRFRCLACHTHNGTGGLTSDQLQELRRHAKPGSLEAVEPPTLTGVGHKLRPEWLGTVLTGAGQPGHGWGCACPSSARRTSASWPRV